MVDPHMYQQGDARPQQAQMISTTTPGAPPNPPPGPAQLIRQSERACESYIQNFSQRNKSPRWDGPPVTPEPVSDELKICLRAAFQAGYRAAGEEAYQVIDRIRFESFMS